MFRFEYKFLNGISYSSFYTVLCTDSNIHYKKRDRQHMLRKKYVELKSLFYKHLPVPEESIFMKPKGKKSKEKRLELLE